MQKHTLFLILLCLALAAEGMAQPYTLKHLGIENGLSNNYVLDIVQDGQGCIWIATELGLNRFDGHNFTSYKSNNSKLTDNALNALLYDGVENRLWMAGKTEGIDVMDCATGQMQTYHSTPDTPINNIAYLTHSTDDGIWLVPHHGNVVHYDKTDKSFTSMADIQGINRSNWCAFDDGEGYLLIGHAQGGMSIVDLKERTAHTLIHHPDDPQSLPGNSVYVIYRDHLENIWVGTNQGLALFNPKTEKFTVFRHEPGNPHSLVADHIYDIKEMNDGTLWVAADIGGISILDLHSITLKDSRSVQFYNITSDNTPNGTSSGNIRTLLQDTFGNIWIGNYSSGIDFISHSQPAFHVLPYMTHKGNTLRHKPVWGIYKDEQEQVWAGGENEIVLFKEDKLVKTYDISAQLTRPYGQVFSIIGDGDHTLLLGIYDDGLLKFDKRTGRAERIPMEMKNVDIITFYRDEDKTIWVGTEYGIYTYKDGTLHKEDSLNSQLKDRSVYGILRDRQGKLWISSYWGGISIFDRNNRETIRLGTANGWLSEAFNSLYMDKSGGVWGATRNGIVYIKDTNHPELFQWYGDEQGLEDTFVRAIHEDNAGNIWVSTNAGISYWNKHKQKFDSYDYRDGIPMGNFIESSACATQEGTLYFGSLNGICYFNPQDLEKEQKVASVQIVGCRELDNLIERHEVENSIPTSGGNIELPYNRNSFRVMFSVPDYSQSNLTEYAYQVDGMGNNAWTRTLGENQVTFRNIAPGEYTLKIKARLRNQEWDDRSMATLKIHIHPPLWLTWYAKTGYVLLALAGLLLWIRFYKRKLLLENSLELERRKSLDEQELNKERLRFYTNITHELRTPLTLILGPLEDLADDTKLPTAYHNKIKLIHGSALRLLNLINQILEFRKTETQNRRLAVARGDLAGLVQETGLRYKELNRNEKVKICVSITGNHVLYFDADVLSTILNNLLSNAVKYTPEGEINLIMQTAKDDGEHRYTEIIVSDTGYGIEPDALPHIFDRYYQADGKHQASGTGIGLALVKSLADLHKAELTVESQPGKGSTFRLRLSADNTYPDALHKELQKESERSREKKREEKEEENETDSLPIVLVVEDNDDIREYIATSFCDNYRILTATNGKEGVELALDKIPDIIISDIMMPVMNGIELCKQVKEDVRTSHIPVVLLTAKDSIHDKEEGYESGADSYLTKPFSAKLLHSRIQNLLESRRKLAKLIADQSKLPQKVRKEVEQATEANPTTAEASSETDMQLSLLDQEFLDRFTRIVEENVNVPELDMTYMQSKMHMSHSTLYRKVKGLTGMSCNELIRKIRLKNSLRLLLEEGHNISEAAYNSGFNDLGYFRLCFKEEYGMLPSEFLKRKK